MNKWTDDQLTAIKNRDGTLLVSAAAGSGKTAVLVERIIRRVIDEKIDINRFLVVTFTNMAAKEMKEKIVRRVAKEIANNPRDMFLREQLSLVHKAQITTVHSFCFNLIRENFTTLKISPDFKISNDLDTTISKKDCMDIVIARYFAEMDVAFSKLVDLLGENNIESEMLKIYDFIQSNANPTGYLEKVCENYQNIINNGFKSSDYYKIIWKKVQKQIRECVKLSEVAVELCDQDDVLKEKNSDLILTENSTILQLCDHVEKGNWDDIHSETNMSFATWKACTKSLNKDIADQAKQNRDQYKKIIAEINALVYISLDEIIEQAKTLYDIIFVINKILIDFDEEYSKDKTQRNVLDFNDAEHKMIELLYDRKSQQKSDLAHEISNRFTEIMVDEYQDTNEIQDTLFKLLSKDEKNIFMVGDVKQSIYKFRLADPMIFLKKSLEYKCSQNAIKGEPRKVTLSKNFRSRDEILQSTNFIFENIMSKDAGGIDYTDEQKLYLGAKYPPYNDAKAEFCLVDAEKFDTDLSTTEIEAQVVASKILDLVDKKYQVYDSDLTCMRDVNFSDIVILLRSTSTKAYVYKKALENVGINIDFKEGSEELFGTPEVSNLISLLKILDNYLLDVDFVAVMRSKIFDFSDQEIAEIRLKNPSTSMYESVVKYESKKTKEMLEKVGKFIKYSQNNSIFKTLWYVIHEFDLLAKYAIMSNGEIRKSNILRFLDFINTLEDGFTIYDFVCFLDKIDSKKVALPSGVKGGHSVRIMTMHASKGLEFPVVFLADMAKEFNKMDLRNPIIAHNLLGLGVKFSDKDNIVSYPSIMQKAIKIQVEDELTAEEMRILYVAMTRPKEKMFVMCTVKSAEKTFEKWLVERDALDCNSYQQWFGMCVVKLPSSKKFYEKFGITDNVKINPAIEDYFDCQYIDSLDAAKSQIEQKKTKNDVEILDFVYPYLNSSNLPSKLTATAAFANENENKHKTIKKPKFMSNSALSATERGIAHHIVMQFIRFENCTDINAIKVEIKRLFDDKFITKAQYECINPQKINAFVNSSIGERLRNSDQLVREFKFSILSDASNFFDTKSDDQVLLQGVIDCLFIENGKIVIVDYKTDSVNENNIDEISKEHQRQLEIYKTAIEQIYNMQVSEKYLYYFKTEDFYQV